MAPTMVAEWETQKGVIMAFPKASSDWAEYLDEAQTCVVAIGRAIAQHERLILITDDAASTAPHFAGLPNVAIVEMPYNDTWMRDCCVIATRDDERVIYNDFVFTGWGGKFAASDDDAISRRLFDAGYFDAPMITYTEILEGGALESDGAGTIMTTSSCLCNPNRNGGPTKATMEAYLAENLGASRVLWLDYGHLEGDDTDGHIDTLARFCSVDTIAYVGLPDESDSHYAAFVAMEQQLKSFRQANGAPYHLVALPFVAPMHYDDERLPATYANFLIVNGAVLVPTYGVPQDDEALHILQNIFINREVIGIDCAVLVRQHGSLHCMTMQLH
ncbi:MAG: hypothetical protein KU37_02555 [Sulfuricurvum sp. PC08-66]|nr:MAG: hypothetical protein KU37_02555 [Sulfuricurvum sp. PC08-66]